MHTSESFFVVSGTARVQLETKVAGRKTMETSMEQGKITDCSAMSKRKQF